MKTDDTKDIFCFTVDRNDPSGSERISVRIKSDGRIMYTSGTSAKPCPSPTVLTTGHIKTFFDKIIALQVHEWPSNSDCCCAFGTTWSILLDYGNTKKRCFGVSGFEPDGWSDFLSLVEQTAQVKFPD